jgi:cytochrome c oxidase accessory protein FixG
MAAYTGITYFVFAWFREQLCIVICPYGRLQSALTDDHSLSIGYDARRGEPRGKLGTPEAGACVDCNRCVQVCPTGIDIRHGLQLECIGCAACIDACDEVMARVKRPAGLIRYDSRHGFEGKATRWLRPRILLYTALALLGAAALTARRSARRHGRPSIGPTARSVIIMARPSTEGIAPCRPTRSTSRARLPSSPARRKPSEESLERLLKPGAAEN